jgi:hypothetical protein
MSTPILDKLPFTLQCLPYGIISTADSEPRCAVAIGDHAIDLFEYAHSGRLESVSEAFGDIEFDHVFGQVSPPIPYQFSLMNNKYIEAKLYDQNRRLTKHQTSPLSTHSPPSTNRSVAPCERKSAKISRPTPCRKHVSWVWMK